MLLATTREKPRSRASASTSIGVAGAGDGAGAERQRIGLARAPMPGGRGRGAAAATCARKKCATSTGCAGRKWVNDGISASPAAEAWPPQRRDQARDGPLKRGDAPAQVQAQIERDLLVPRPAGVQPTSGVSEALDEQPLDEAVDVLVARRSTKAGFATPCARIPLSAARSPVPRRSCQHTRPGEGPRPCQASGHVVLEQAPIEAERGAPLESRRVGGSLETTGPERGRRSLIVCHQSWIPERRPWVILAGQRSRSANLVFLPTRSTGRRGSRP